MSKDAIKIPFLLVGPKGAKRFSKRFGLAGRVIAKTMPNLDSSMKKLNSDYDVESFCNSAFISATIYAAIFGALVYFILNLRGEENIVGQTLGIGIAIFVIFLGLMLIYPRILIKKVAVKETKELLFALRELMMDVDSGVPLFDAMKNVSEAKYGFVSKDFEEVIKQIDTGLSETEALKALAIKTESEHLKRAIWQLINAIESGVSTSSALISIINSLEGHLFREIKSYSANLNFMMLIYMLASAALPSMGVTLAVLLSAFSGIGVNSTTLYMLIGVSAFIQIVMIGFMSSSRPEIFGG